MSATWLSYLLKVGSVLISTLLVSSTTQVSNPRILFDRGLPSENVNVEPDAKRSNLRWRGGHRNESFYGDDFTIGEFGEHYVVDHVRTWAVLGYREEGPDTPEAVGNWFSQIKLLGGEVSEEQLAVRAIGGLDAGSSSPSNPDITITQVMYPDNRSSKYFNFGPTVPIWQIDFHNLNWSVEGGRRYNFSVQGVGRQFLDTEYSHAWYNHASNAVLSGTLQQGADDLMSAFSDTGRFLRIVDGRDMWNKPTDLNIQVFGHAVADVEDMPNNSNHNIPLVDVVANLNEAGLLTDKTYNRTVREVEQGIIKLKSQLLSKLVEQDSPSGYTTYARIEVGSLSDVQPILDQLNNELEQLNSTSVLTVLEQLNSTGVLTASVYEHLKSEVASGSLSYKLQLYQTAKNQLEREESVNPNLLQPRLEALRTADIISEQGYGSLLKALEASELQNPIEFLTYTERSHMFDLTNYPTEPALYFPAIYQSVAQMLSRTGLINGKVGAFDLKLTPDQTMEEIYKLAQENSQDSVGEWRSYDALVSVRVGNRDYEQSSYYSPPSNDQDFLGHIESDGIVNLFNKVLRDQSSPYRLFSIHSFDPHVDYSRFGVIALTEAQADVYWKGSWHETDYTNAFTSDRIEKTVTLLSDIGLLDHLSEDETSKGKRQVAHQYITHPYQLLSAFNDVVLLFDWESAEGETPYRYLLESLSDISRGGFNPIDIDDNFDWDDQTAGLAFTLNGTRHSTDLEFHSDWLDPKFFEFVESVVAKEKLTGKFYPLSEDGYGTEGYIFLSDEQLETLRSQQLIISPTE